MAPRTDQAKLPRTEDRRELAYTLGPMTAGVRRTALYLTVGAVIGLTAEAAWRHDYTRLLFAPATDALVDGGMRDFYNSTSVEGGLGPVFNATSCGTCHYLPETGGVGTQIVLRRDNGLFGASAIDPRCQPQPSGHERFTRRIATPLFGAGFVDGIPDDAIVANADPEDRDDDGIRGRAAMVDDPASGRRRVARFGWKAQDASLLAAVARALAFEIGVTNRLFPEEALSGIDASLVASCDTVADPEDTYDIGKRSTSLDRLAAFVRQLQPRAADTAADGAGARVFDAVGCAACHRPVVSSSLAGTRAYSDFLLHDIGTGDGVAQGDAGPHEMRTAPLWGLHTRRLLLHDGSAFTLAAAIAGHRGEADAVRQRYDALPATDRQTLLAFLKSL
jgi:CxxC motif-containing protein (DUF1111 family)